MRLESRKYLFDIQQAAQFLDEFISEKSFEDYQSNPMLRSAVERQFEIIGEAMSRLSKTDPDVASRIRDYRRIIAFRNVLIHGYADVDDRVVWSVLVRNLPTLRIEIDELLASSDPGAGT